MYLYIVKFTNLDQTPFLWDQLYFKKEKKQPSNVKPKLMMIFGFFKALSHELFKSTKLKLTYKYKMQAYRAYVYSINNSKYHISCHVTWLVASPGVYIPQPNLIFFPPPFPAS